MASTPVIDGTLEVVDFEQITGLSSAKGLTTATYGAGTIALLQAESQPIRWRDAGTDPTASVGMRLTPGSDPWPYSGSLAAIKFIEEAASGKLNCSYYQG